MSDLRPVQHISHLVWTWPLAGELKLNADGAFVAQNDQAGCGNNSTSEG
jgi:hypothetical protein